MYYVYLLQSINHDFRYTGMTKHLEQRLAQHNRGNTPSTQFYKPFNILHTEIFDNQKEARQREKYLKTAAGRRSIKKKYP